MTPEDWQNFTPETLKDVDISYQLDLIRTSLRPDLHREIAGNVAQHLARLEEDLRDARAGSMSVLGAAAGLEAQLKASQERIEELELVLLGMNPGIAHTHWITLTPGEKANAAANHLKTMRQSAQALNGQVTMALQERDTFRNESAEAHKKIEGFKETIKAALQDRDAARKEIEGLQNEREHSVAREAEAARLLQEIREECGTLRAQLAEATSDAQRWQENAKNVGKACNDNCDGQFRRLKRRHKRRILTLKIANQRLARAVQNLGAVVELVSK